MIKERILETLESLRKEYKSLSRTELYQKYFKEYEYDEYETALNKLIDSYDVFLNRNNKVVLAKDLQYVKGVVTGLDNSRVFVKIPDYERDVKIDLFHSSTSNIRLKDDVLLKGHNYNYKLEKIIKHNLTEVVAEYVKDNLKHEKVGHYVLDNKNYKIKLSVSPNDTKNLVDGSKVVLKLSDTKLGTKADLVKIIGHKNDPGVDIASKVLDSGAPVTFSKEAIKEVNNLPEGVDIKDFPNRLDLTRNMIFTIDGEDAKDLDDAVEVYKLENGNYKLGVHIADVTHYVKEGSALDKEAQERGTSIYLANTVVTMYPYKLSNGISSLNPLVDRLVMTCYMEIDKNGNIVSRETKESVINSKKRFTYTEVNKILEENDPLTIKENKEFVPTLKLMHELSHILRNSRNKRGQLELETEECKIIVDEDGKVKDVVLRERGEGEKLIEDFMIAANEAVASIFEELELPSLYRVHDRPDTYKLKTFIDLSRAVGVYKPYNEKMNIPEYFRSVLDSTDDKTKKDILSSYFLRCLPKAVYSPENIGHFGLGSESYTHFTAPIRRYPDTIINRLLKKYVINKEYKKSYFDVSYYNSLMEELGESTSMQERRADELERDIDDMKKAEYMESKIDEEYIGKVSGFIEKGFFVRLPNTIEGFVNFNSLNGHYTYNKEKFQAESKNKTIKLGDSFKVVVVGANKETSRIDFEVVRKLEKEDSNNKKKENNCARRR